MFNGIVQIGFFVFGFGMIFVWTFVSNVDLSFITFRGAIERTTGHVTQVVETNAKESHTRIYANHYAYSVGGQLHEGVSYSKGDDLAAGAQVDVEYKASNPAVSRIAGMRTGMFSPAVLFVVIFPAIGAVLIYAGFVSGKRRNYLLGNGMFTTGKLVGKRPTNMRVNKRTVYELTFEFTAIDGRQCKATANSSITDKLEDESEEPLLYDPNDPEKACLLDDAPARPQFNEIGELRGNMVKAMALLILPAIVMAANALALVLKLR